MAVRGRGAGAVVVAVIFAGLFVITLLVAILLATQIRKAKTTAEEANAALSRYVTPAEQRSPEVTDLLNAAAGQSVVKRLGDENRKLKSMITGSAQITADTIAADLTAKTIPSPLLGEITRLRAEEVAAQQKIQSMQRERDQALEDAEQARRESAQFAQAYQNSIDDLKAQLARQQTTQTGWQEQVQGKITGFEGRYDELQQQSDTALAEKDRRIAQLEGETTDLRRRLNEMTLSSRSGGEVDARVQPDGRIISTIPDEDIVYINLGRRSQLVLGMTFEVFGVGQVISVNDLDILSRGKATIEVIEIAENSATCRVTRRTQGQGALVDGDVIANVVYDPQMVLKFKVHGEFDIDNIGSATRADRTRIEGLIEQWGGVVVEGVSFDTDYLVLGEEPVMPDPLDPGVIDPIEIQQHAAAVKRFEDYMALITQARDLTIPILNQNRFLVMIGYYRR